MKKSLIAMGVMAMVASTSASAIDLYRQDGTSIETYGGVRVALQKSSHKSTDLFDDDSRIGLKVEHILAQDWKALGGLEFRFGSSKNQSYDKDDVYVRNAFAGFQYAPIGTLTFGRQDTTMDDLHRSNFAYNNEKVYGFTGIQDHAQKSIRFKSTNYYGLTFGADYIFGDNRDNEDNDNKGYVVGLMYDRELDNGLAFGLSAGAFRYSHTNHIAMGYDQKTVSKGYMLGGQVRYQDFTFGIDHAQNKLDSGDYPLLPNYKSRATQVSLKYQITPDVSAFGSYAFLKTAEEKGKSWIIGADYKLHKNVVTFAQFNQVKWKDLDVKDNITTVGLRVMW